MYNDKCGNGKQGGEAKIYPDSHVDAIINSRYLVNDVIDWCEGKNQWQCLCGTWYLLYKVKYWDGGA